MSETRDVFLELTEIKTILNENIPIIKTNISNIQKTVTDLDQRVKLHKQFCEMTVNASERRFNRLEEGAQTIMNINHAVNEHDRIMKETQEERKFTKNESKKTLIATIGGLIGAAVTAFAAWLIGSGGKTP